MLAFSSAVGRGARGHPFLASCKPPLLWTVRMATPASTPRRAFRTIDAELRIRAGRLLAGRPRTDDLDQLYLSQRDRAHGRASFREIGDFVAHRGERSKGPITQQVRDVFTSFRVWSLGLRGRRPTLADLRAAGAANLRLLTDEKVEAGTGLRREAARTRLGKAFRKLEVGRPPSENDRRVLDFLANQFVWRPAFTDDDLVRDFADVLMLNGILDDGDRQRAAGLRRILALHAITRMHGTDIVLEDGSVAALRAGFANKDRLLEIKADLGFKDWTKPVHAPVCMFLTALTPEGNCDPALIGDDAAAMWNAWSDPLELSLDGTLAAVG